MIIKEAVSLPNAAGSKMLFGIYENGLPYYQPIPTEIEYQINLADPNPSFKDYADKYVAPWDMLPGKYLFYNNLFPGGKITTLARGDVRTELIETVRFSAPNIVEANGNAHGSLDSRINAKGLRGI
jgi:hypothetical protein